MSDPRQPPRRGPSGDPQKVRRFWERVEATAARIADRIANKRRNNVAGLLLRSVVVDPAGHVIAGGAGGSGGMIVWHYNTAGSYTVSLSAGTSEDVILYGTPDYDPGGAVATSGGTDWEFTAPAAGYYRFELGVQTRSHFWENGEDCYMFLEENAGATSWGTLWDWNLFPVASTTSPMFMRGVQTILLAAGDVIRPMWGIQLSNAEASYVIEPNWIAIYQV